ncbi:OPT oligopeptide transporter protein-domain-containing protein [Limtongia smithiae]|uniref:OPT oligopeptide transporter protein-domain-containing protein n=1 Tax=Limtongia smithiae TaxID=1125753 RepID=UPI0034CE25BF
MKSDAEKSEVELSAEESEEVVSKEIYPLSYDKDGTLITVNGLADIPDLRAKARSRLAAGANKHMEDIVDSPSSEYLLDMMTTLGLEEAIQVLTEAAEYHKDDSNFPHDTMNKIHLLLEGEENSGLDHEDYILDVLLEATLIKFHSPYPEVRAVCDPIDYPDMVVETFRSYFIGCVWVAVGAFINELFSFRQPALKLNSTAIQVLIYPCGKFCEKFLPDVGFTYKGVRHSLNPGPWTFKEQMLATLMVNVGAGSSNLMSYILVMKLERFFDQNWVSFGFSFLLNFSTQFFGFGLGGLLRRWVVYPIKAVWPSLLPTLVLTRTLTLKESKRSINGWSISKYKLFWITGGLMFLYYWLPGYCFTALSTFNWMTWIAPTNVKLAIVTGSGLGLGFNPWTTFDWAVINYSSALAIPFFAQLNRYSGMVAGGLIMIILLWKNYKWTGYIPVNSNTTWDNTGKSYNASRIVNSDLSLNHEAYEAYSPPFISIGYLLFYGAEFALIPLSFIYVGMQEWPQIRDAFNGFYQGIKNRAMSAYELTSDPISRHMAKYPEVPDLWYFIVLVISIVFGIVSCQAWPTHTPFWAPVIIIIICIIMMIPNAIIFSVTGYQMTLNDIGIIVGGYMVPEHAISNMVCRVYGYNVDTQAESFIGDQKLAHYAKIPPRAMFRCQMIAVVIQVFMTIAAIYAAMDSFPELCSTTEPNRFVCPFANALFTATLVWGVVGPKRTFSTLYPILKWAFLIGTLVGPPLFYLRKYFYKQLKHFNPILFLSGMMLFSNSYNLAYFTPGIQFSWLFMHYIKNRYLAWWTKYNYVLTAALAAGVALSAILIFVSVQVTKTSVVWWGTSVSSAGVDGKKVGKLFIPPVNQTFGPTVWH